MEAKTGLEKNLVDTLFEIPEVLEAHTITGDYDNTVWYQFGISLRALDLSFGAALPFISGIFYSIY